ncbi:hypothetical protein [Paracoccus sp. (in: a-proteobacteria)]|uniref:hypothetical protein n=1 Tax=Paracoccus sp. TaxID=267 RepID=UPI003A8574B8
MSGLGTGIAALVNGYATGREIRHRWDDREDDKARQKKLDEYRAAAEGRLAERYGWDRDRQDAYMGAQRRSGQQWQQAWDDDQALRAALASAADAGDAGMIEPARTAAAPSVPVQPAAPRRAPDMPVQPSDTRATPQVMPMGAVRDDGGLFEDAGNGKVVATRVPRSPEERAAIAQAAREGRLTIGADVAARQAQIDETGNLMASAPSAIRALQADPNADRWGRGTFATDIVETGKALGRGALMAPEAMANSGLRGVRQAQQIMNVPRRWIFGREDDLVENVDLNGDGKKTGLIRETGGMPAPLPPKNATKAEAATVDAAAKVVDDMGDDPAMRAAAGGMELGATPGKPVTAAQREKAATGFWESWRENGVPIIQKALIRQGRFEDAKRLSEFANDAAAQEGMRNWSRGLFSAMNGDLDAAADAMIDAYNSNGYFDDGYEIVRDQSALIRDKAGEVTGIRLAMRNQQTGEVNTQEASLPDWITRGLWLTSPQKAMEVHLQRQQGMQEQLLQLDEERRRQAGDLIKEEFRATNAAALKLMETSIGLDGKPAISYEEALAQVQRARGGGAAAGQATETPVLHRPK